MLPCFFQSLSELCICIFLKLLNIFVYKFFMCSSHFFYWFSLPDLANANEFPRDFWGISLQEQPDKYYFVIRGQRLVMEAESSIQTIMEKLQSYKTRVALNFEVAWNVQFMNSKFLIASQNLWLNWKAHLIFYYYLIIRCTWFTLAELVWDW